MQNLEKEIQNIRDLQFDFKVEECQKACLSLLLETKENLHEVKSIQGFCQQFSDPKKSYMTLSKVFEESPYFFKNTSYLLHIMSQQYCEKGKKIAKQVISLYEQYQGEKDIYYYISLSLAKFIDDSDNHQGTKQIILQGYIDKSKANQQGSQEQQQNEKEEINQDSLFEEILETLNQQEKALVYHNMGKEKLYLFLMDQEDKQLFDESVKLLELSLQAQPNNTMTMQLLALLLVHQIENEEQNLESALEIYNQALEINPHDLIMNVYYCELLIKLGQFAKCDEVLTGIMEYKQTPYVYNKYLQYISFSHMYRFKDFNIDFENLFQLLMKMIEYDGEDYYNFDSFCHLIYLVQYSKQLNQWKHHIEIALEQFSICYPNFLTKMKQLVGFEQQVQNYLNLITQNMQEQSLRIHSLTVYQKLVEPEMIFMGKYTHWDSYFD